MIKSKKIVLITQCTVVVITCTHNIITFWAGLNTHLNLYRSTVHVYTIYIYILYIDYKLAAEMYFFIYTERERNCTNVKLELTRSDTWPPDGFSLEISSFMGLIFSSWLALAASAHKYSLVIAENKVQSK